VDGGLIPWLHSTYGILQTTAYLGPYGTKLGHSWYQWIIKSDLSGWFDNSEKGEVFGHCRWMWCWSRGCTPSEECCKLPPTYFWTTWHQIRAFLIWMKNESGFSAGLTILKKEMWLGIVGGYGVDPVVALHLRNAVDYRLPNFGPHGTKLGHSWFQWIIKVIFLAGLNILKKETCLGSWSACGGDPMVPLHLRNTADYRLSTLRPHGTKLGNSWFQWKTKNDVVGWFDNFEKGDVSVNFERLRGWSWGFTPPQ